MSNFVIDRDTHLRPVRMDDASELFALVDANRPHLRRWLTWVDATTSAESVRQFLKSAIHQNDNGQGPVYSIMHRGAMVGICGFKPIDCKNRAAELGYWLSELVMGHGIMTRCVKAMIDYAFRDLDINRIEIRAATENSRSRAVAERLALTHEGDLREAEWLNDHFVDQAVYSVLKHEWISQQSLAPDGEDAATVGRR